MTRVKICGLMNLRDTELCVRAGVDMLGFVVDYPLPVPWNLSRRVARELIRSVSPFVSTCLVTGGTVDQVMKTVEETCPNVVQLHYKESLQEVGELADLLGRRGIKTIKALRINGEGRCDFEITDPALASKALSATGISAILTDAYTDSRPGGTGVALDLSIYQTVRDHANVPVILAGGLNPANIRQVVARTKPYGVDVLTGVEMEPGCKDGDKVRRFISVVHDSPSSKW